MSRPALVLSSVRQATDPDQRFFLEMLDHHQGLIYLVHETMQRPISKKAHDVLDRFDATEDAEKREMSELLRMLFGRSHDPKPSNDDRREADSLLRESSDPGFHRMAMQFVISHHRRGIRMVDSFLTRARRPRVRELAVAIKRKEQREVAFYQKRLAAE